jgi:hypothetical protein
VPEQRGSLRADRLEDGADVVHPLLEGRELVVGHAVGKPVPRLSKRMRREKEARRSRKCAIAGSSHISSMFETQPGT